MASSTICSAWLPGLCISLVDASKTLLAQLIRAYLYYLVLFGKLNHIFFKEKKYYGKRTAISQKVKDKTLFQNVSLGQFSFSYMDV